MRFTSWIIAIRDVIENGTKDVRRRRCAARSKCIHFPFTRSNGTSTISKRQCIKDGSDIGNKSKAVFSPEDFQFIVLLIFIKIYFASINKDLLYVELISSTVLFINCFIVNK